jgi:cytochrome c
MRKASSMMFVLMVSSLGLFAQAPALDSTKAWFNMSDSSAFKGKYKMEGVGFDYMEVSVRDSSLFFAGGEYAGILTPLKDRKDSFDAMGQAVFAFVRSASGEIDLVRIDYNGGVYEGKKDKQQVTR